MELRTTYTVKLSNGNIWQFKYNLNGVLVYFDVVAGELSEKSEEWLYIKGKFPYKEESIKLWKHKYKGIIVEPCYPDYSFNALWNLYNYKVKKFEAEKAFKKFKKEDIIKCFISIRGYDKYLADTGIAKAHLSTFINKRYFEDDWSKVK